MKKRILITLTLITFTISAFAGIEWTSKISTTAKKKRNRNEMVLKMAAQHGVVRQDYISVERKQGMIKENTYWIFNSKDNMIYVVNPDDKTVIPMSLDYMLNMAQMANKIVKIKIEDYKAESRTIGIERVNGFNCKHIKLTTDYTMKMKIAFIKKQLIIHEEKEIWGSKSIKGLSHLNSMFLNKNFKTGFKDLDALIKKQMAQNKDLGFPVKTIVRQIHKNKKGKVKSDITTTTTIENIISKKFPNSYFEIPKGYSVSDPLQGPQS